MAAFRTVRFDSASAPCGFEATNSHLAPMMDVGNGMECCGGVEIEGDADGIAVGAERALPQLEH